MNSDLKEACKTIAEFMGGPYEGDPCMNNADMAYIGYGNTSLLDYCKKNYVCKKCDGIEMHYNSLDALVPVWRKILDTEHGTETNNKLMVPLLLIDIMKHAASLMYTYGLTIQQAACLATAKCIKELEK